MEFKRAPLTDYQLHFLLPYILHKRKKEQSLKEKSGCERKFDENKDCENSSNTASDTVVIKSDDVEKNMTTHKQSENESPVDIADQIRIFQGHLESLKKEKHSLFQQLKLVLHDEDEKKKQEEQKLELEKTTPLAEVYDPRQQVGLGLKRPYSSIMSSSYLGASPLKRQSRGPLLPTPEGSASAHFSRQNSGGSFHGIQESFHQGGKPLFSPRTPSAQPGSRPPYPLEHRLGSSYSIPSDVQMQGTINEGSNVGPIDSPLLSRTSQASAIFAQPNTHEIQPQYQAGMAVGNFQYTPTPSPYGSMTNIHGPSGPSQPVQLQYAQSGSFVQQHEIHPYNQPLPQDLPIKAHPIFSPIGGQSGHQPAEHLSSGSFPAPLHDPRHQKLVSGEHIQSPHYSS